MNQPLIFILLKEVEVNLRRYLKQVSLNFLLAYTNDVLVRYVSHTGLHVFKFRCAGHAPYM